MATVRELRGLDGVHVRLWCVDQPNTCMGRWAADSNASSVVASGPQTARTLKGLYIGW